MYDLKQGARMFAQTVDKNAPTILTGIAVFGAIAIAITSYRQVPKAREIIARKKQDLADVAPDDKDAKHAVIGELVKEVVPVMAPVAVSTGVTIACVIASNKIHLGREAAITTAYLAANQSLREWKQATKDSLEKKEYEKIEEKVRDDKVKEIINANGGMENIQKQMLPGQHLFIDKATNQIFYDDLNRIIRVVDGLNNDFDTGREEFKTWNELLMDLGEKRVDGVNGDTLGFNSTTGGIKLDYGSYIEDDTNVVYAWIDYPVEPRYSYG